MPDRLSILTYHSLDTSASIISVDPRQFAEQMRCMRELGVRGISLRDAMTYRASHHRWPPHAAVLTFDDGYANTYEHALPVLIRENFSATVFVVSDHIGGRNDWCPPPPGLGAQRMLSWKQIEELAAAGIEIGAHTKTHPDLTRLSAEQAEEEIVASRHDLERHLDAPVTSFAYPFGKLGDAPLSIVRREFQAACSTVLQHAGQDEVHALPRIDAYYLRSHGRFERLLLGRLDHYLALRRWGRSVAHPIVDGVGSAMASLINRGVG